MVRLCEPTKASVSAIVILLLAYIASISIATSNPTGAAQHTVDLSVQGGSVATLAILVTVATRRCDSRWTWSWVTLALLATNLAARLASLAFVDSHGKAKFVRWDAAAKTIGMVAVLAELYYSVTPTARFRTLLFFLGLIFVVPVALALPRAFSKTTVSADTMKTAVALSSQAYDAYDGKNHSTRVITRVVNGVGYVAFAGTETAQDWKIDGDMRDDKVPWLTGPARAHAGFLRLYGRLRDSVRASVARFPAGVTTVAFVGHSLGGALATLAALDHAAAPGSDQAKITTLVTFGAPQVGDVDFVKAFDRRVDAAVRVVNPFDPIPKAMAAQLVHTKGYRAVASLTRDSPHSAHNIDTYRIALDRPRWVQVAGVVAPATYVALAGALVVGYHVFLRRRSP